MPLRTVAVPEAFAPLFEQAEAVVSAYFEQRSDNASRGTIEIFDERYVLMRAGALSVEFFGVVRELLGPSRQAEADAFARNLLFDLAHAVGRSDARKFCKKMQLNDPLARLAAGPVHFSHAGWAFVDIDPESRPSPDESYYLLYDHPYSFESESWAEAAEQAEFPVCVMNAGYSSGWCEEAYNVPLVATEVMCKARGDDACRFVMAHPDQIDRRVADYAERHGLATAHLTKAGVPDLYARRNLQRELRQARDELEVRVEQRTEELRLAYERLEKEIEERAAVEQMLLQSQKIEALGLLAGGMAHDFNNLLTVIGGYGEMVANQMATDSPVAKAAMEIVSAADRAAALTRQLLVFSRARTPTAAPVDISRVLSQLRGLLLPLIGGDVRLHIGSSSDPCVVEIDPNQLEMVLVNLVVNARDAMPGGGDVSIELERVADEDGSEWVDLIVTDDGVGMDEQTAARIFDPFFTTKRDGAGTGLGLVTTRTIVQQAGGQMQIATQPGLGTSITLSFPALPRDARVPTTRARSMPAAMAPKSVLIVEDERVVRELMTSVLQRLGHRVQVAENAPSALTIFDADPDIDLVVADVIMPDISGPQMVREMRQERPDLAVIFVSGYTADRLRDFDLQDERAAFVQKPFRLGQIEEVMATLMAQ